MRPSPRATCVVLGIVGSAVSIASAQSIGLRRFVSWGDPDKTTPVHECAVAGSGSKWVALWMSGAGFGDDPVWYNVSTDGGSTWSCLRNPLGGLDSRSLDPSVAADADGRFVAVFAGSSPFGAQSLFTAVMEPGSDTFDTPVVRAGGFNDLTTIAIGPGALQGQVYYHVATTSGAGVIRYLRGSRLLNNWTWPQIASIPKDPGAEIEAFPSAAVSPDGWNVYLAYFDQRKDEFQRDVYHLRLLKSTSRGDSGTFYRTSLFQRVTARDYNPYIQGAYRVPGFGHLAIDPSEPNRLYLVYNDVTGEPGEDADVDVYLIRSDDEGENWSAPVRVNQDDPQIDPLRDQFMPRISCDASGRIHIIWYDTRRLYRPDPNEPYDLDLFYAYSVDAGDTFTEVNLGTTVRWSQLTQEQFIGDYNGIASSGSVTVPVYMGTPINVIVDGGDEEEGDGGLDDNCPVPVDDTNEAIFSRRISF